MIGKWGGPPGPQPTPSSACRVNDERVRGDPRGRGRPPRYRAGFTLLEVLVATLIMGIAVTGLIAGLSQSVKNAARLTEYDRAAMLARTKMSDLLLDVSLPFDGSADGQFDTSQTGGVPGGWRASLKAFDVPPNAGPGTVILQRIALEIWWQPAAGTRRTMQLTSYRPARIPQTAGP